MNRHLRIPTWIRYGGRAWFPALGDYRTLPDRIWPVVDLTWDERGSGVIVRVVGGDSETDLDAVIDERDFNEMGGEADDYRNRANA